MSSTSTTARPPQTTSFEVEIFFPFPKESKFRRFDSFEEMADKIKIEKRRKKVSDRATHANYKNVLTAHGRETYLQKYGTNDLGTLSGIFGIAIGQWLRW